MKKMQDIADLLEKFTILYVEDDEDVREQLCLYLRHRSKNLLVAENGLSGLKAFEEHRPDIVITDILMPAMNGLEMAARIRAIDPHVAIIVTTAFEQTDLLIRAIDTGIDRYVVKPIERAKLEQALEVCARRLQAEEHSRLAEMVFKNSSESMLVTDAEGKIVCVNNAFTRLTGYEADEVIGEDASILNSGRQSEAFFSDMWQTLRSTGKWHGEIWNRRKGGEVYAQWMSVDTIFDPQGLPHRYVALFFDITRLKAKQPSGEPIRRIEESFAEIHDLNQQLQSRAHQEALDAFEFANMDHPVMAELQRIFIQRQMLKPD